MDINQQLQHPQEWWLTWLITIKGMVYKWAWCYQELIKMDPICIISIQKEVELKAIFSVSDPVWHMPMVSLIHSIDMIWVLMKPFNSEEELFIMPQIEIQLLEVLLEFSMFIKVDGPKK